MESRSSLRAIFGNVYCFFLDGLDEGAIHGRRIVVDFLDRLSRKWPQHRWVLASRWVDLLYEENALSTFDRFALVPSPEWAAKYFDARLLSSELSSALERAPSVQQLIEIPQYAAAVATRLERGEEVSSSALRLILEFADAGLEVEKDRLRLSTEQARRWLDSTALSMELRGVSEMPKDEAVESLGALGITTPGNTLAHLLEVCLLGDRGDVVQFPANTIQEARAARKILSCNNPMQFLKSNLIVGEVGGQGVVAPTWVHTIDLLLTDAPTPIRDEISRYDPLAVARTTNPEASYDVRADALKTIWCWYREARVWITHGDEGKVRTERDAFRFLCHSDDPPDILDEVRLCLADPDDSVRGNAIIVLLLLNDQRGVQPHLAELIADQNDVVGRFACHAAAHFRAEDVLEVLLDASCHGDELRREAAARAALRVAPKENLESVVQRVLPTDRWAVYAAIGERLTRVEEIHLMRVCGLNDSNWVRRLLRRAEAWTEEEIEALVCLVLESSGGLGEMDHGVFAVLAKHGPWTLETLFKSDLEPSDWMDVFSLAVGTADEELKRIAESGAGANADVVAHKIVANRQRHSACGESPGKLVEPQATLEAKIVSGVWNPLEEMDISSGDFDVLSVEWKAVARSLVREGWDRMARECESFPESVQVTSDGYRASRAAWNLLRCASVVGLELSCAEWHGIARLDLAGDDAEHWLRMTYSDSWVATSRSLLRSLNRAEIAGIAKGLPSPWEPEVRRRLAALCFKWSTEARVQTMAIEELGHIGEFGMLRALWKRSRNIGAAVELIKLGACDIESELLLRAIDDDMMLPGCAETKRWIPHLKCQESACSLADLIRRSLIGGVEMHDIEGALLALENCAGNGVVAILDVWISDSAIPSAQFLIHRKIAAARRLLEQDRQSRLDGALDQIALESF